MQFTPAQSPLHALMQRVGGGKRPSRLPIPTRRPVRSGKTGPPCGLKPSQAKTSSLREVLQRGGSEGTARCMPAASGAEARRGQSRLPVPRNRAGASGLGSSTPLPALQRACNLPARQGQRKPETGEPTGGAAGPEDDEPTNDRNGRPLPAAPQDQPWQKQREAEAGFRPAKRQEGSWRGRSALCRQGVARLPAIPEGVSEPGPGRALAGDDGNEKDDGAVRVQTVAHHLPVVFTYAAAPTQGFIETPGEDGVGPMTADHAPQTSPVRPLARSKAVRRTRRGRCRCRIACTAPADDEAAKHAGKGKSHATCSLGLGGWHKAGTSAAKSHRSCDDDTDQITAAKEELKSRLSERMAQADSEEDRAGHDGAAVDGEDETSRPSVKCCLGRLKGTFRNVSRRLRTRQVRANGAEDEPVDEQDGRVLHKATSAAKLHRSQAAQTEETQVLLL